METNVDMIRRRINLINDMEVLRLLLARYLCIALDESDGVGYMKIMNELDQIIMSKGGGNEEKKIEANRQVNEEVKSIEGKEL